MDDRRPNVIQQDDDRCVTAEADGTITKTFTGRHDREQAEREAHRLRRFGRALQGIEGATCPKVYYVDGPPWRVHMERAPGRSLASRLAATLFSAGELEATADVLASAVECYVGAFSEPYYDFHLRNVVSDPTTHLLSFVDFHVPNELADALDVMDGYDPLEVSLGNLVGSTVFEALRPRAVRVSREHKAQSFALARAVVGRCVHGPQAPTPSGVAAVARLSYRASAYRGGVARRVWYTARGDAMGQASRVIARIANQRPLA